MTVPGKLAIASTHLSNLDGADRAAIHESCLELEQQFFGQPRSSQDWAICLELVRIKRRYYGDKDTEKVFDRIVTEDLRMPCEGATADGLWSIWVLLGKRTPRVLEQSITYAEKLLLRYLDAWDGLYRAILSNLTGGPTTSALQIHQRLKKHFPPTKKDYTKLFYVVLQRHETMKTFASIYQDYPVHGLHSFIIQGLVSKNWFADAAHWHYLLLKAGDTPNNFGVLQRLLEHYSKIEDATEVGKLVKSLGRSGSWSEKTIDTYVRKGPVLGREMLNRALGQTFGIEPKPISDHFCARLFATKLFSVDMVISGLSAIGADRVGPASLREIAVRAHNLCQGHSLCQNLCSHLSMLQEAGISLDSSRYTRMLRASALSGNGKQLKFMVESDLHPDTFEDEALQERLLAMHERNQDRSKINRTLEILLFGLSNDKIPTKRANIMLRCSIALENKDSMNKLLMAMSRQGQRIDADSVIAFRKKYLTTRRITKRPPDRRHDREDLLMLINLMRSTMESSGGLLPIGAWREILRRLGMYGKLREYENLALWLAEKYRTNSTTKFADSPIDIDRQRTLKSLQSPQMFNSGVQAEPLPSDASAVVGSPHIDTGTLDILIPPFLEPSKPNPTSKSVAPRPIRPPEAERQPERHLLKLFNLSAQQAMIAWGFQAGIKNHPGLLRFASNKRLMRVDIHWSWGLRLLKVLQSRGVPVKDSDVKRACCYRLLQLFSTNLESDRVVNRRAKELNYWRAARSHKYSILEYVQKMRHIWGENLFSSQIPQDLLWEIRRSVKHDIARTEATARRISSTAH